MRQFAWSWSCRVSILFVPYARRVKSDKLNWIWFQPSSKRIGIVQIKGFTRVVLWKFEARKRRRMFLSSKTFTSKEKYFFKFLMIITRKGNLIPRVFFGSPGQVM